jgi:hypothetical protein
MSAMDRYSLEGWMLDRQREVERNADEYSHLHPWHRRRSVARVVAVRLRHLADRLDGRTTITVVSGS